MAQKELAIFHKSQWNKGKFKGSRVTENDVLLNRLKELDNKDFEDPVYSNWSNGVINSEYADIKRSGNFIRLTANKPDNEKTLDTEELAVIETSFLKENLPYELDYVSINFDWHTLKTNFEEQAIIQLNDGDSFIHNIILNNQSEVKIITTDGMTKKTSSILDSSANSIGSITSVIDNDMEDFFLDIRLEFDDGEGIYHIYTRLRSLGYESIWYDHPFGSKKIANLKLILKSRPKVRSIIKNELTIKEIYVEGFADNFSYESQVFDSGENDTIWNCLTIDGVFPVYSLRNSGPNSFELEVRASNNKETLKDMEPIRYSVVPGRKDFIYEKELEELTGRYLFIKIAPSTNRNYQNQINYIKANYTLPSTLKGYREIEVTEAIAENTIGPEGGVVHLDTDYFSAKLYIPPQALMTEETIRIRRIASEENIFASDIIGFEFSPGGLNFNVPALLEVDYANFPFGPYQSEDGLRIAYLDGEEPEELDTVINKNKKKAIAYIEHFSMYALMATDDLYLLRTGNAALKFPRWMKVREKESNFQKFLNHGIFQEIENLRSIYFQVIKNYFLDMANEKMRHVSFKTILDDFKYRDENIIINNTGRFVAKYKGKYIPITFDERKFYVSEKEFCYVNLRNRSIYFTQPYDLQYLKLIDKETGKEYYSTNKKLQYHKIWNVFDEHALFFNLERNLKEDNESLRERILDFGKNPGNSTREGLLNHIARELGISKKDIRIHTLTNSDYLETLKNADGSASKELKSIANYINNYLNIYWDQFVWDEGYWISNLDLQVGFIY